MVKLFSIEISIDLMVVWCTIVQIRGYLLAFAFVGFDTCVIAFSNSKQFNGAIVLMDGCVDLIRACCEHNDVWV